MPPMNTDLIPSIRQSIDIDLPDDISFELLKQKLSTHINQLIQSDFEKLVSLLYRIDISEPKLRQLLQQKKGEDAADTITEMIIERQLQKIKSRKEKRNNNEVPDDEKW
jgi:hypothetical protein